MRRRSSRVWRRVAAAAVVCAAGSGVVGGTNAARGQVGLWLARQPGRVERIEVASQEITLPLDALRSARAVWFRVGDASGRDRVTSARVDDADAGVLAVDRPGTVIAGETVGYAWVRPIGVGVATLRLGDATIRVRVVESAKVEEGLTLAPRILAPSAGAAVWGRMQVSVRAWREPVGADGSERPMTLRLAVPDGLGGEKQLEPVWMTGTDAGPVVLASFSVDFDALPPGSCTLRAVRTLADGSERESGAASVRIVRPSTEDLIDGECETDYGLMALRQIGPPVAPRSERDPAASGGRFFSNAGADPRFRFPVNVPSERGAGWYQIVLTAAGDPAAGAMPAVGLRLDEAERLMAAGQIAQPGWHRMAIGTPVRLEPGLRVLRCDFANDFSLRGADRNLRMDRIEVLRVADVDARDGGATDAGGTMMAGDGDAMQATAMMASGGGAGAGGGGGGGDAMSSMMAGESGGGSADLGWPATANAAVRPPVRIAFERPLDGLWVQGESEIRGFVAFEGQNAKSPRTPPRVDLIINGRTVASQRTDAPRFTLTPDAWRAGANSVQMRATGASGWSTATVAQTVFHDSVHTDAAQRASSRITIHEPGWFGLKRGQWKDNQGGEGKWSAPLASSSQILLELPEGLSGEFDLLLESRAPSGGQAVALSVIDGGLDGTNLPPTPVATLKGGVPNWYGTHRITDRSAPGVRLGEGKKTLLIAVPPRSGKWESGKGDKNALWIQAVRLVQRPESRDVAGPAASVLYPQNGAAMFDADALVIRSSDAASAIKSAEVVIDGTPTGLSFDLSRSFGLGDTVLPVVLRDVAPGEHVLSARISDDAGNVTSTEPRSVIVLAAAPEGGTTYTRSVAVLDRLAFGPDQRELAAILALGVRGYVEDRLGLASGSRRVDGDDPALALGQARFPNARSGYDVPRRALQQAISAGNPVRARFTLWAENHFSTWIRKDESYRKADEHDRFSMLGIARFYDLLRASSTSPAMLRYLDQERSFAGRLNENYAREILELHTVGVHGGYSQEDVTNLAHVLTGWTTSRQALAAIPEASPDEDWLAEDFSYEPAAAATLKEPRTVLGCRFGAEPADRRHERVLAALEVLDAHPSTARYICHKLVEHYVGPTDDDRLIDDLASVFSRTGGDLREVILALAEHPAFRAAAVTRSRLAHPVDFGVRLCRVANWNAPWDVGDYLGNAGKGLFDRPTPDGYPESDKDAMDSNALLQRWRLAAKADGAIADLVPPSMRYTERPIAEADAQRIIDVIAVRLTGATLSAASNAAAIEMLRSTEPVLPARPEDLSRDGRIRTVGAFIAQLPEGSVR